MLKKGLDEGSLHNFGYVNILTSTIVTHRLNTACAWAEASPASKGH